MQASQSLDLDSGFIQGLPTSLNPGGRFALPICFGDHLIIAIGFKNDQKTAITALLHLAGIIAISMAAGPTASLAQDQFMSTRPVARQEYWQTRETEIARQLGKVNDLPRYKLVFIGDSITDFWQMHEDLWVKGRWHGGAIWDETFGGADPALYALNLGISGDRTEHMLYRLMPKSAGGQGELDHPDLNPEYLVIMAGINNSWSPEPRTEIGRAHV